MLINPKRKATESTSAPKSENAKNFELARALAGDVNTAPDKLRELAASRDRAVRENLVTNLNTPIDILWELGAQFPEQLLHNPKFERLIRANSIFLKQMPFKTASNLFFHKAASDRLREQLLSYHPGLMDY
jgi:hypothetical protein